MTYFDSCYLAKLYLLESDSMRVRAYAEEQRGLVCSAIGLGEVVATLHRQVREKRFTFGEFQQLTAQVAADMACGVWTSLPITPAVIEAQLRFMSALPETVFLRAADALHLTSAAEAGVKEIFSSDRHLCAAAPHFGHRAVTL